MNDIQIKREKAKNFIKEFMIDGKGSRQLNAMIII